MMGNLTIPLWRVLELTRDSGNGRSIGLDEYPIFDENERDEINRLIIRHFYLRDIGQETISMFTYFMRRTMREIMPTYNQLYKSMKLDFDPLSTYDLSTVRESNTSETAGSKNDSSTTNTASAKSRAVNFDTPQTALSGNADYASSAADANSSNTGSGTATGTNSSTSTGNAKDTSGTTGRQGSANRLLAEFRANIINTDQMLLNDPELNQMFMLVWDDGEEIMLPHINRRAIL